MIFHIIYLQSYSCSRILFLSTDLDPREVRPVTEWTVLACIVLKWLHTRLNEVLGLKGLISFRCFGIKFTPQKTEFQTFQY